jgi:FkbM family methyltransferase
LCVTWGAQVYLIEPNPKVWSNIRAIWESNNLPTPVTFPGFASNSTESLGVEPTRGWPDCAYEDIIAAHGFKELHTESQSYPQIKLDDLYEKFQEPPTFLSFDVEGSEFHVLRGAERSIDTFKPIIYASIHPEICAGDFRQQVADPLVGQIHAVQLVLIVDHQLGVTLVIDPVAQVVVPAGIEPAGEPVSACPLGPSSTCI